MTRIHDRALGHGRQGLQTVVHGSRVAAGKIGASAAVEEQGVATDQAAIDVEALAARRMTRCVHERDRDVAHMHHITPVVLYQLIGRQPAGARDPRRLGALHVHRATAPLEQCGDALHLVPAERAADVVGVEVSGQNPSDGHAIGLDHVEQFVHCVGGVDEHAFARGPVADCVDEVDHLLRHRVVDGEVATGEQLTEVEAIRTHAPTLRRLSHSRRCWG